MKRRLIMLGLAAIACASFMAWACGTQIGVTEEIPVIDPPPSDIRSAGILSGFGYATGGNHYKVVQSLGSPFAEDIQTSDNGRYSIK